LSTLTGARENEADDWLPMQRFLLELRRRGIAVILVHHAGRNGHARGTSRREDILDTVISLKRPEDYEANHGARFVLEFEKARGFSGEDAAPIEATLVIDPTSGAISWEFGPPRDAFGRAMEMFSEGRSVKDVIAELGVAKPTAYRWHQKFRSGG
jgi:putative DNA primase/helicase